MLAHLANLQSRMAALLTSPRVMGIVNVTPNSFSDAGAHLNPDAAAAHAAKLVEDGAAILDLGAEASSFFREGVQPVEPAEQIARLLPVLAKVKHLPALISIDTRSAEVAKVAIENGAHILNDISAGEHDANMFAAAAELEVPLILMHISPGYPLKIAQDEADIGVSVIHYLEGRIAAARAQGILQHNLLLDPGLGFGKSMADNWRLLAALPNLHKLGYPLVLGASRKRFLETLPPEDINANWRQKLQTILQNTAAEPKPEHPRDPATAAVTQIAGWSAHFHRVHNAALAVRALAGASV